MPACRKSKATVPAPYGGPALALATKKVFFRRKKGYIRFFFQVGKSVTTSRLLPFIFARFFYAGQALCAWGKSS